MISSRVVEAITPLELSRASALFGVLKQVRVQLKTSDEYSLDKAFESHVHSVLEKLDQRLVSIDDATIQKVEIIMAKHGKQLDHDVIVGCVVSDYDFIQCNAILCRSI